MHPLTPFSLFLVPIESEQPEKSPPQYFPAANGQLIEALNGTVGTAGFAAHADRFAPRPQGFVRFALDKVCSFAKGKQALSPQGGPLKKGKKISSGFVGGCFLLDAQIM